MTSTEIATYRQDNGTVLGIDEIDASDMVAPRFQIDHNKGVWRNSQTGQEYSEFTAILLCRVKQRIMWKNKLTDEADPQCRSNNFNDGFPNDNPASKSADMFPWDRSVFDKSLEVIQPARNNRVVLTCKDCNFKDWSGDDKPPCKEQWTFAALVFLATPIAPEGEWCPVLMTIQGTGIPSIRPYISQFVQRRAPLFTAQAQVSLRSEQKGGNDYFVPVFTAAGPSDSAQWGAFAEQTKTFVGFLKQDPRGYDGSTNSTVTIDAPAPAVAPIQAAPAPVAEPAPIQAPPVAAEPAPTNEIVDAEVVEDAPAPVSPPPAPAPAAPTVAAPAVSTPAAQPAPAASTPSAAPTPAPATSSTVSTPPTVAPGNLPF